MKRMSTVLISSALVWLFVASGCGGSPDPNEGFRVQVLVNSNGIDFQQTGHLVADFLSATSSTTSGTITHFDQTVGFTQLVGAKVPGRWRFQITFFSCFLVPNTQVVEMNVNRGDTVRLRCFASGAGNFTASPDPVDAFNPPAIGTIYGQGIDGTYGMPKVQYFDANGTLVGEGTVTAVASDGTWLQGYVPDLTSAYSGTYTILIKNKRADGSKYIIGAANVTVYANEPPPPDPGGDPCDCQTSNCQVCDY